MDMLEELMNYVHGCSKCRLCENRRNTVFGEGYERGSFLILPTYHPSALLRDPGKKRDSWNDFKSIREKLKECNTIDAVENG